MSERDMRHIDVLSQVVSGRREVAIGGRDPCPKRASGPPALGATSVKRRGRAGNRARGFGEGAPAGWDSDIESGNRFLGQFTTRCNDRFCVAPARSENLHRPLLVTPDRLQDILCHPSSVASASSLRSPITESGSTSRELNSPRAPFPYFTFDKAQRVTHAAIVESKFLGEMLAWIKVRQDLERPPPRIKSNSEATDYRPEGCRAWRRAAPPAGAGSPTLTHARGRRLEQVSG